MVERLMQHGFAYFVVVAGIFNLGLLDGAYIPPPQTSTMPQSWTAPPRPRTASGKEEVADVDSYERPGYEGFDQYRDDHPRDYPQEVNLPQQNNSDIKDINRYDVEPNHPMTDWNYKSSWQYNKKGYFEGKTQPEVYRENHPYGYGGIGYDADPEYLRLEKMQKEYAEQKEKLDRLLAENEATNQTPRPNQVQGSSGQNSVNQTGTVASNKTQSDRDKRRERIERKNWKRYNNPRDMSHKQSPQDQ